MILTTSWLQQYLLLPEDGRPLLLRPLTMRPVKLATLLFGLRCNVLAGSLVSLRTGWASCSGADCPWVFEKSLFCQVVSNAMIVGCELCCLVFAASSICSLFSQAFYR